MSASCPSASSITLPGCGSAWNTPSCSICSRNVRKQRVGELHAVGDRHAAPVDLAHARAVEPLHDEHARRAEVLVHERHPDVRVARASWRRWRARCALRCGSRAPRAGGPRTRRRDRRPGTRVPSSCASRPRGPAPRAPTGRPAPTRRSRAAAPSPRRARRSGSCARYTWPIDAAATGCQSNPRNTSLTGASSSSSSTSAMPSRGAGRTWSCNMPSSAAACGEMRSVRVLRHLTELHEHAAALLEREPQPPHGWAAARVLDVVLAPETERRDRDRCAPRCG